MLFGLALTAALCVLAFTTTGGVALASNTWAEIVAVLIGAGVATALLLRAPGRLSGRGALALFGALAALTFASIAWSVAPAASWVEANRTLSYLAAFAAALLLARLAPGRWRALLGAIAGYAVVICAYALLTKVFPASMDAGDTLARVRAPFDYYNATGLVAAMGIPAWLWFAARPEGARRGDRVVAALSVPALALLVCTLVMSYGRGALGAAVVALALWFALVPLRLRGTLALALGVLGGGALSLWATRQPAIAHDSMPLAARVSAGHDFGVVLAVGLVVLVGVGVAMVVLRRRVVLPKALRRRIGVGLICLLGLIPVAGVVGLAASSRGFGGEVSHLWNTLTNPNGFVLDQPGRLAQLGSSRPRYWRDGLWVGEHAPLAGTGAFGFAVAAQRYSPDRVLEAHSYVIQTFADLGAIGLLVSAALLVAWILAVRVTLGRRAPGGESRAGPAVADERAGMITLLAVAVVFGVHSTIDWTWFIPGAAVPALLCAGWVAGRGALCGQRPGGAGAARPRLRLSGLRLGAAIAVATAALLAAWIVWQPLRSSDAQAAAVAALVHGDAGTALTDARTAAASDPLDVAPPELLASIQTALGNLPAARAELVKATTIAPSDPQPWNILAVFDIDHGRRALAMAEEAVAHRLGPWNY